MTYREDIRQLFTLRPGPWRWPIAVQAGLAMGIPVAGFTIAGRADLGLLASTGAFTALYLANRSRRERAALLPLVALGLILSACIGVATAQSLVASLAALFIVAALSATLCFGFAVGPPGALFFVLVTGVSNHLAGPAALKGDGLSGALVVGILAIGCLVAYLVVLAPLALPGVRARDAEMYGRRLPVRFVFDEIARTILFRLVLASAIAVLVAAPLGVHRVYWVLMTVVAILQNGHRLRLTGLRAVHRVLGTFVGLGLFVLVVLWNPTGLWLAAALATLQFLVELVVVRNYGLALVFITPLALTIATQGQSVNLGAVVFDRVVDTLLGTAIALAVMLIALAIRTIRPSATPA